MRHVSTFFPCVARFIQSTSAWSHFHHMYSNLPSKGIIIPKHVLVFCNVLHIWKCAAIRKPLETFITIGATQYRLDVFFVIYSLLLLLLKKSLYTTTFGTVMQEYACTMVKILHFLYDASLGWRPEVFHLWTLDVAISRVRSLWLLFHVAVAYPISLWFFVIYNLLPLLLKKVFTAQTFICSQLLLLPGMWSQACSLFST